MKINAALGYMTCFSLVSLYEQFQYKRTNQMVQPYLAAGEPNRRTCFSLLSYANNSIELTFVLLCFKNR